MSTVRKGPLSDLATFGITTRIWSPLTLPKRATMLALKSLEYWDSRCCVFLISKLTIATGSLTSTTTRNALTIETLRSEADPLKKILSLDHTLSGIIDRARQPAQFSNPKFSEEAMSAKYIFVTGGVVSSLGKGLAAASIGCLLESRGLKVNLMKFDPYLNVDPGTMSPFQHGEVFVTDDGAESDLDMGHSERLHHAKLSRDNNWTTGRIYEQ